MRLVYPLTEARVDRAAVRLCKYRNASRGFALIELAVVLIVVSLLLSAGLLALNSQLDVQRSSTTHQRLAEIKSAMSSFVSRTGRLPCPAKADLAPSAVGYGIEAVRVTGATPGCTGTIAAGDGFKGVVPWTTLGLPSGEANDGWSRRITYQVSRLGIFDLAGSELIQPSTAGMRGSITVHNNTPVALGLPATGNQTNACSTTAGDNSCNLFGVAILVSHGKNGLGAWQENGIQMAMPASGSREEVNADNDAAYLDVQYLDSGDAQHFDDIVMTLAPRDVLASLVESKQMKPESAVMFEGLAAINGGVLFYAVNHKSGVNYTLPADLTEVHTALNNLVPRDAWGNPLQYDRNVLVTDVYPSMTFSGTVYTVTSFGPDGALGGGDDRTWGTSASEMLLRINESPFK